MTFYSIFDYKIQFFFTIHIIKKNDASSTDALHGQHFFEKREIEEDDWLIDFTDRTDWIDY